MAREGTGINGERRGKGRGTRRAGEAKRREGKERKGEEEGGSEGKEEKGRKGRGRKGRERERGSERKRLTLHPLGQVRVWDLRTYQPLHT